MTKVIITKEEVKKVGALANLSLTDVEIEKFSSQFSKTIEVVNDLNEIDTTGIVPTSQVNHLTNVTRNDVIDHDRVFTQAEALACAKNVHKGYFVVKQILDKNSE